MMKAAIAYKDPGPLEDQDDRTLCEVWAAAYRQDQQHGASDVEPA